MYHIFQIHHLITSSRPPSKTGFIIIFMFETTEAERRELIAQYHTANKWCHQGSIVCAFSLRQGVHSIFHSCQSPLWRLLKCSCPFFLTTVPPWKEVACPKPLCSYFRLHDANMNSFTLCYVVLYYMSCYKFLTWLLFQSLCAQFAMESLPINQLYGSDSPEAAERDIQYFFPPEHTAALIKPHVTQEQRGKYIKIEPMYTFFFSFVKFCKLQ